MNSTKNTKNSTKNLFDILSEQFSKEELIAADISSNIAFSIIKYRHEHGMTQKQLAEKTKVTQAMVSKWENGDYNFTIESLAKLCVQLGMQLNCEISEPAEPKLFPLPKKKNEYSYNSIGTSGGCVAYGA